MYPYSPYLFPILGEFEGLPERGAVITPARTINKILKNESL